MSPQVISFSGKWSICLKEHACLITLAAYLISMLSASLREEWKGDHAHWHPKLRVVFAEMAPASTAPSQSTVSPQELNSLHNLIWHDADVSVRPIMQRREIPPALKPASLPFNILVGSYSLYLSKGRQDFLTMSISPLALEMPLCLAQQSCRQRSVRLCIQVGEQLLKRTKPERQAYMACIASALMSQSSDKVWSAHFLHNIQHEYKIIHTIYSVAMLLFGRVITVVAMRLA